MSLTYSFNRTHLKLSMHIEIIYYCENTYLVRHRYEQTCASASYYQMDSVTKTMHYKAKHAFHLTKPCALVCTLEDSPSPLEYFTYQVINRTESFKCFLLQPYYTIWPNQC